MISPLTRSKLLSLALMLVVALPAMAQDQDPVSRAMHDELARSAARLSLPKLDKPYFIAYRVDDLHAAVISSTLGALTSSNESRARLLAIEMRVGDYALDNTNFIAMQSVRWNRPGTTSALPLDDDYDQLRRAIWLATDRSYKQAAETLASKRSVLEHRQGSPALPDFSHQPAFKLEQAPANLKFDVPALEQLARTVSAVFRDFPNIYVSTVDISIRDAFTRYLNSEGTWFTRPSPMVMLNVGAQVRGPDGLPLRDSFQVFGENPDVLQQAELVARTRKFASDLEAQRDAPKLDSYTGPVLFQGEAAAQALAQVLAPALTASRFPITDQPQFEAQFQQVMSRFGGGSLADRIGGRVLPAAFDLADEPRTANLAKVPLLGDSQVDDDGVPTSEVKLVDHGILKTLLATRVPTEHSNRSTGSRRQLGPSPSNLILSVRGGLSEAQLKNQLLTQAKQRGLDSALIIRRVGPAGLSWMTKLIQSRMSGSAPLAAEVYRVFPDGHEERVRPPEVQPMSATDFKDIDAAGDTPFVYNGPYIPLATSIFGVLGGGGLGDSNAALVSYVTPSLLFDDVTLKANAGPAPDAPVAPSPLAATSVALEQR